MSEEKVRNKGGRPPYSPTDQQRTEVRNMAAFGITNDQIGKILEISQETLRKYFEKELETGRSQVIYDIAKNVAMVAKSDRPNNMVAAALFLKTQGGWKDASKVEISGPNGGPIKTEVNLAGELSVLDKNTLIELQEVLARSDDVEDYDEDEE